MTFELRACRVEAIIVDDAIRLAVTDWKALPQWFRDQYEAGNIVIGCDRIYLTARDDRSKTTTTFTGGMMMYYNATIGIKATNIQQFTKEYQNPENLSYEQVEGERQTYFRAGMNARKQGDKWTFNDEWGPEHYNNAYRFLTTEVDSREL